MHQLMRRAALAAVGAGLGVAAAVTMAAGPSFAQATEAETAFLILSFQDLDTPPQPESGDKIDAHGYIGDGADPTQTLGTFTWHGQFIDGDSAWIVIQHYLTGGESLVFSFEAEYDATAGAYLLPEGQDIALTDSSPGYLAGSAYLTPVDGTTYEWRQTAFLPTPGA